LSVGIGFGLQSIVNNFVSGLIIMFERSLKVGDFFGEISLVDEGPRSADVQALEDCELLRVTRTTIGVLSGLQPAAAVQILSSIGRELVQRLRTANQKYLDLLHRLAR
jgi:CRP-like cAMP-binding protein